MVVVKRKKGDTNDKLINSFRKQTLNSGILDDIREKARFTKKSEARKLQKAEKKHNIKLEKRRIKRMA